MNSVVRQLLEQNTDVVMVDTGDSYEGICRYFKGTYITYSKEKPISMNPFKITDTEYAQNFGEKKNFLKSLIFLIFKGSEAPTKIEDKIINQTIVEYYESYFTPFKEFTDTERDQLRKRLLLEDKKNGTYEKHSKELEEKYKHSEYETSSPLPKHPKIHLPLADRILNTVLSILLMAVVWPMMVLYILLRRRKLTHESSGR